MRSKSAWRAVMKAKMKLPDWQDAVAKVIGAVNCSPVEKQRAFQLLHDTGIGYRLPGHISDTLRHMVATGVVKTEETNG